MKTVTWVVGAGAVFAVLAGYFMQKPEVPLLPRQQAGVSTTGSMPDAKAVAPNADDSSLPEAFKIDRSGRSDFQRYLAIGTPSAAMDAYQLVANCRRSRHLDASVATFSAPEDKQLREAFEAERVRMKGACKNITPEDEQQRLALLDKAAQAGIRGAALAFLNEGYQGDPAATMARKAEPEVQAWADRAIGYLKIAGVKGDRDAIATLAALYDNEQSLTGRQPAEALKYVTAMQASAGRPPRGAEKVWTKRLMAQLTPEQAAAAQEAGRQLAQGRQQ